MADLPKQLLTAIQLQQAGQLEEAASYYTNFLKEQPNHADANHLLGLVLHEQGEDVAALIMIEKAIKQRSDVAIYHANRGRILKICGKKSEAALAFASALRKQPADPEILSDLAGTTLELGNADKALMFVIRALEHDPDLASGHYNYGLVLKIKKQHQAAKAAFKKCIELEPDFVGALFELGLLFQMEGQTEYAEFYYRKVLAVDSNFFEAYVNLGNILRGRYELEESVDHYRSALAIEPNEAATHGNLGVALQELGKPEAALEAYDHSITLDPENAEIQRNRSQVLLQMGCYLEGWEGFEWRWKTEHFRAIRREWEFPKWTGESDKNASILLHAEQGFGDTIQFSRYVNQVAERIGRVLVECPLPLKGLIENCPGIDEVVVTGRSLPHFDFHIPMMSLPGVFKTEIKTIPREFPYMFVTENLRKKWADRIEGKGLLKVGLVWKGSYKHQRNAWRSPGLAALKPLLDIDGIHWVSLQKEDEMRDLRDVAMASRINPLGAQFQNFTDTAAVITHLDLVISPDTAVAHLAGALNQPVWIMLPYVAEWRWLMDRADSPWYPSMRLFRQHVRQDWSSTVSKIAYNLKLLVQS